MSVISELRAEQRRLAVGDKVVVYVPWQGDFDRTYWEGKITEAVDFGTGIAFHIQRDKRDKAEGPFHHTFCFPERLRGRVRYSPSRRLRIA